MNIDEIYYLKTKIAEHKRLQEEVNAAKLLEIEAYEKNWVGKYPYMRWIHCPVDNDRIKHDYLRRHDLDTSRLSLENWNSDIRETTAFEMILDCWHDPPFEPLSEELPGLYPDFQFSESCHSIW